MGKNKNGSALLLMLLVCLLVTGLSILALKNITWVQLMQQQVIQKEKTFRFAKGVLDCAVARATGEFDSILKKGKPLNGALIHEKWVADFTLVPQQGQIVASCCLKLGDETLETLSVVLTKNNQGIVSAQSFQR